MKDGNYQYPNRFRLQKVAGTEDVFDLVFAPGEVYQEGDYFAKANLFPETLIPKFWPQGGAPANPQVKDGLDLLSRFQGGLGNEWVWEKYLEGQTVSLGTSTGAAAGCLSQYSNTASTATIYYSEKVGEDCKPLNPKAITVSYDTYGNANVLKGKYWYSSQYASKEYFSYTEPTAPNVTRGYNSVNGTYSVNIASKKVTSVVATKTNTSFVNSPNPAAYPPVPADGYTYTRLGQIGECVRIKTLEYTGTGTAGPSNPTTISIGFSPKMVMIDTTNSGGLSYDYAPSYPPLFWRAGFGGMHWLIAGDGSSGKNKVINAGSTFSWYNESGTGSASEYQANAVNVKYRVIAIG